MLPAERKNCHLYEQGNPATKKLKNFFYPLKPFIQSGGIRGGKKLPRPISAVAEIRTMVM